MGVEVEVAVDPVDWSYGLLDDDEQQVLNQLAVFAGTLSLSGVDAVVASTATRVLEVMDSLVEQSLVVASVDSGRYRLLETVRLYALDRLLNSDQLASTRDRHLAWMRALSGRERWPSLADGELGELEEEKLAEVANALAAMEWAKQNSNHDALLSLYIGGQFTWPSTGGLDVTWLDRIPAPSKNDPNLRSQWLATSGETRVFAGDEAALASAMQMETVGRTLARYAGDSSVAIKATLLALAERYDEALAAAQQGLDSQVLAQSNRMNLMAPAAESLAALGRYEAALDVVEKDFGPMVDALRARLMRSQLVALVLILHPLQRHERINELAGVAYAYTRDGGAAEFEVRTNLANIIGGDEALAALPTPDPADMTTDRVATLIEDIITEIRDHIAAGN